MNIFLFPFFLPQRVAHYIVLCCILSTNSISRKPIYTGSEFFLILLLLTLLTPVLCHICVLSLSSQSPLSCTGVLRVCLSSQLQTMLQQIIWAHVLSFL